MLMACRKMPCNWKLQLEIICFISEEDQPASLLSASCSRPKAVIQASTKMVRELYWLFKEHATILANSTKGSGARKWKCNYCGLERTSNVARIRQHMHGFHAKKQGRCEKISQDIVKKIQDKLGCSSVEATAEVQVLKQDSPGVDMRVTGPPSKKMKQGRLSKASWANAQKKQARIEVRRCIIMCNLSFNVLRTKQWKRMINAVAQIGTSWKGVGYNTMRQQELDKEIEIVDEELKPIKEKWAKYGCSIITDGWTDRRRRHVMNIMISSCMGTVFHRAVDCSKAGLKITGRFIFKEIQRTIEEIGAANVVQVITDNGSNCKSMGLKHLEKEYSTIFWTPCASHSLDLLLEDIGKIPWVSSVIERAGQLVNFFHSKPSALSIYKENSHLELLRPSSTRFGYQFIMLERLLHVREHLIRTVVSDLWKAWAWHGEPDALRTRRWCYDTNIWDEMEAIVKGLSPIYTVLRITDMEGSTLGLIYEFMERINEALDEFQKTHRTLDSTRIEAIKEIIKKRWNWFHRPIHAVAHILHPLWRSDLQFADVELNKGWHEYITKVFTEGDMQEKLNEQLHTFRNNLGLFAIPAATKREVMLKPIVWWESYGSSTPELQKLALRVLSQDCSSGPCERNWSSYSLIQTKKRSKLSLLQLERLIYCRENLKLVDKYKKMPNANQVNIDKIDITKTATDQLPIISPADRDVYSLLYNEMEEADVPHTRSRLRACDVASSSSAVIDIKECADPDDSETEEEDNNDDHFEMQEAADDETEEEDVWVSEEEEESDSEDAE